MQFKVSPQFPARIERFATLGTLMQIREDGHQIYIGIGKSSPDQMARVFYGLIKQFIAARLG